MVGFEAAGCAAAVGVGLLTGNYAVAIVLLAWTGVMAYRLSRGGYTYDVTTIYGSSVLEGFKAWAWREVTFYAGLGGLTLLSYVPHACLCFISLSVYVHVFACTYVWLPRTTSVGVECRLSQR